MSVIAEKRWSYVLFDEGEGWILTTLIGGVVEIDVSIRLTSEEMSEVERNISYVESLASEVRRNRAKFSAREIVPPVWPKK